MKTVFLFVLTMVVLFGAMTVSYRRGVYEGCLRGRARDGLITKWDTIECSHISE